jgi:hypothetical protein
LWQSRTRRREDWRREPAALRSCFWTLTSATLSSRHSLHHLPLRCNSGIDLSCSMMLRYMKTMAVRCSCNITDLPQVPAQLCAMVPVHSGRGLHGACSNESYRHTVCCSAAGDTEERRALADGAAQGATAGRIPGAPAADYAPDERYWHEKADRNINLCRLPPAQQCMC